MKNVDDSTPAYKNCCDHCGKLVDKKYWTFNLDQCVVCDDLECKDKQKEILNNAMNDLVNAMLEGHVKP